MLLVMTLIARSRHQTSELQVFKLNGQKKMVATHLYGYIFTPSQ